MWELDARAIMTLIGVGISLLVILMGLAAAWGSLRTQVKSNHEQTQAEFLGVNGRLDRINGTVAGHGEELSRQGQRIAWLEGSHDPVGD